jgi:hypothetical protein
MHRPLVAALCLGLLLSLTGCGSSTYEERLAKTDQRNRHIARLNAALDGYWKQELWGIWLRPPKGLVNVPAPLPAKEGEEEAPDPRLEFQGVPLDIPGIIQVWDGTLPATGGAGSPYRIYLLGNHSRYANRGGEGASNDPKTYFYDLEIVLQSFYGVTLPDGDRGRGDQNNERYRQQIPNSEQFAVPKPFVLVNFVPQQEGAQPFNALLMEHTAGQVQFALLALLPPNATNEARQNLLTSVETLQISSQTPGLSTSMPSGGGGSTF